MGLKQRFLDAIGYKPDAYELETGKYPACWPDNHPGIACESFDPISGMVAKSVTAASPITFVDMGPEDVLILHAPDTLGRDEYLRQKRNLRHALKRPGRVELILDGGATITVVRRKEETQKIAQLDASAVIVQSKPEPLAGFISGTDKEPSSKPDDPLTAELKKMKREMDGVDPEPTALASVASYHPLNKAHS